MAYAVEAVMFNKKKKINNMFIIVAIKALFYD